MPVVTIEEVTTGDAVPKVAPNKISANPAKDTLIYKADIAASAAIQAIRTRFEPTNRNTGRLLFSRGMVCGTGDRCGTPVARTLVMAPAEITDEIDKAELGAEPDGEYDVQVFAMNESEGWAE